jgi:hypothetical protein
MHAPTTRRASVIHEKIGFGPNSDNATTRLKP